MRPPLPLIRNDGYKPTRKEMPKNGLSINASYFGDSPGPVPIGPQDRYKPGTKPTEPPQTEAQGAGIPSTPYTETASFAPSEVTATVLPALPDNIATVQAPANPVVQEQMATIGPPIPSTPTPTTQPMQARRSPERRPNGFAFSRNVR